MAAEQLETIDELAERWRVSKGWVYGRTAPSATERLPHLKLGKYLRFDRQAVDRWLEDKQQGLAESVEASGA